jgi:hypothetical protein
MACCGVTAKAFAFQTKSQLQQKHNKKKTQWWGAACICTLAQMTLP